MKLQSESRELYLSSIGVLLVTAILIALGGILLWEANQVSNQRLWVQHTYSVTIEIERLERNVREAESIQRASLLLGSSGEGVLPSFRSSSAEAVKSLKALASLVQDNHAQMERVKALEPLIKERLAFLESNANQLPSLPASEQHRRILAGVIKTSEISQLIEAMRTHEAMLLDQRASSASGTEKRLVWLSIAGSFLGVLVLVLTTWLQRRHRRQSERYQQSLTAARDTALNAASTMSNFVASVSHEIRTPINGVLGAADLLKRDRRLSVDQLDLVNTILTSGRGLLEIINDILDLSKLRAGKMELRSETFSLGLLLDDVFSLFADPVGRKRLELNYIISPGVGSLLRGDNQRLRQILVNLVGNAIKFTDSGSVRVQVSRLSVESGRNLVRFEVVDTGPGISPEDQKMLFEPFTRGNVALSQRHAGTGLGLAISREIAVQLNGSIGVESRVGAGTTFWFTAALPEADDVCPIPAALPVSGSLLLIESRAQTAEAITQHVAGWKMDAVRLPGIESLPELGPTKHWAAVVIGQPAGATWQDANQALSRANGFAGVPRFLLCLPASNPPPDVLEAEGIKACLRLPFKPSDLYDLLVKDTGSSTSLLSQPVNTLPSAHVLLVEDNPINQRIFSRQLSELGMRSEVCGDGPEGIAKRIGGRHDLILMDCQLPTMDGFEATRKIRAWENEHQAPRIPIIAVTAHVMPGDAEACFRAGMDDYLPKPFDLDQLAKMLGRWLKPGNNAGNDIAAAPAAPELLDLRLLQACLSGDPVDDADLVKTLVDDTKERLDELGVARQEADLSRWQRTAHRAKGSLATMGCSKLAGVLGVMEQTAPTDPEAQTLLEEAGALFEKTREALKSKGLY